MNYKKKYLKYKLKYLKKGGSNFDLQELANSGLTPQELFDAALELQELGSDDSDDSYYSDDSDEYYVFKNVNPMLVENEQPIDMSNPTWFVHTNQDVPDDLASNGWIKLVSLKGTVIYLNNNFNQVMKDFDYDFYVKQGLIEEKPQIYSLHNRIAFTIDEAKLKQSEATDEEGNLLEW